MNLLKLRKFARASLAIASSAIIIGGAMMFFGWIDLGDALMIFGAALLIIGAAALAQTPTEDKDAALDGTKGDAS